MVELTIAEDVLGCYPALCRALDERERYIEALSRTRGNQGTYDGGERMSEQEALYDRKMRDPEYAELDAAVDAIGAGLMSLTTRQRVIVLLADFEGMSVRQAAAEMGLSLATAWRERKRALYLMKDVCFTLYPLVRRFRQAARQAIYSRAQAAECG